MYYIINIMDVKIQLKTVLIFMVKNLTIILMIIYKTISKGRVSYGVVNWSDITPSIKMVAIFRNIL